MSKLKAKNRTIIVLAVSLCFIGATFLSGKVNALKGTCKNTTKSENTSIYYACHDCHSQGSDMVCGTMWISGSSSTSDISSSAKVNQMSGKATVYIHGASLFTSNAINASHISFIESNKRIVGTDKGHTKFTPLSYHKTMARQANSDPMKNNIKSKVVKATLNVSAITRSNRSYTLKDGQRVYTIKLQAFRCPQGATPAAGNTSCYSDPTVLKLTIPNETRTLTLKSVDNNYRSLSSVGGLQDQSVTVTYGTDAGIRRGSNNDYEFLGYKTISSNTAGYITASSGSQYVKDGAYHVKSLVSNATVYAVYKKKPTNPPCTENCEPRPYEPPKTNEASINMQVKNNNVERFDQYTDKVFAKPGDKVSFSATYTPTPQSSKDIEVGLIKINGGTKINNGELKKLSRVFDEQPQNQNKKWKNAFTLEGYGTNLGDKFFTVGDSSRKTDTNESQIKDTDVGKALTRTISLNKNDNTQSTPTKVEISYKGRPIENADGTIEQREVEANILLENKSASANVFVPHNFETSVSLSAFDKKLQVFAGEALTTELSIEVEDKYNELTEASYATTVQKGKYALQLCYGGSNGMANCANHESESTEFKPGNTIEKTLQTVVPDVPAGTKVCMRAGVYPSDSGPDDNYTNPEGSKEWRWSNDVAEEEQSGEDDDDAGGSSEQPDEETPDEEASCDPDDDYCFDIDYSNQGAETADVQINEQGYRCVVVAKRPSLQVWGGNVFSRGRITTSVSRKTHVAGVNNYSMIASNNSTTYQFGSFSELAVMSMSSINGFSSGASMGYASSNSSRLSPTPTPSASVNNNGLNNPGGTNQTAFCKRSLLTMPNRNCKDDIGITNDNYSLSSISLEYDKDNILSKMLDQPYNEITSNGITINDDSPAVSIGANAFRINGASIGPNKTVFVYGKGKIRIGSNLVYTGTYNTLDQMPKLTIYAKGDIIIDCAVNRIDALLISETNVETCVDGNDLNDAKRSNQLIVNGAILSKSITPSRTYGAATGANSIVPAEIINFDPSLYSWGKQIKIQEESGDDDTRLDVVHLSEAAPRY